MPYLRLLTNALVAGTLGAAMLAHLVLLLNPQLPLHPGVLYSLGWRLLVTAGPLLAGGFFIASLARYLVTRRGPGWLSLRILAWTTTVVVGGGALLAWLNLSAFGPSLSAAAGRRAVVVALTLASTACVLLLIALVHYGFGRRGSRVGGAVLGIAVLAAVVLPLVARGPAEPVPGPRRAVRSVDPSLREPAAGRVWVVLLDGASLDYVSPAAAQGRLPNFGRLLDRWRVAHAVLDRAAPAIAHLGFGGDRSLSPGHARAGAGALSRRVGDGRPVAAVRPGRPARALRRAARRRAATVGSACGTDVARARERRVSGCSPPGGR